MNTVETRLLKSVIKKRGYLLPYHELFLDISSELLESYDTFYENITLKERHLDSKTKELVWAGILMSVNEKAGTLHLKRGKAAGITDQEFTEVMTLVQLATGFECFIFFKNNWQEEFPNIDSFNCYCSFLNEITSNMKLRKVAIELIFIGIYSALSQNEGLRLHLKRAKDLGINDEQIAEAISYIFIPCGGNVLIDAAEIFKDIVKN